MIFKLLSLLLIQLFILLNNEVTGLERKNDNPGKGNDKTGISFRYDSIIENPFVEKLIVQEINYYAPYSGKAYLAWLPENYTVDEAAKLNPGSKFMYDLLVTPIPIYGDTFKIRLNIPEGTVIRYCFWITKNKKGHYQDYWDLQSGGKIIASGVNPLYIKAIYSKGETAKINSVVNKGWIILLLFIVFYGLVYWITIRLGINKKRSPQASSIFFIGISLAFFHALARSEIIGISQMKIILNPGLLVNVLKASTGDFIFIIYLIALFIIILWLIKNDKLRKIVYLFFIVLTFFSTLIAFTNITIVSFLGNPFNYQWLYYSDFLGSDEAKTALMENMSIEKAFNLLFIGISMLILSKILIRINRMLEINKKIKFTAYSSVVLISLTFVFQSAKTKPVWTKGQSENAITCMVNSMIMLDSSSTFFTAEISEDSILFEQDLGTGSKSAIEIPEDHNVKNVLFVVLESAGAIYFDAYGGSYQLSPNLNRLAGRSLMFDQAYAHAPATNRSLVSLLGSVYPWISYKSLTQEAPEFEHPTISSVLKEKGYRTSFFSSANLNFQNCREFLAHRNFDLIEDCLTIQCEEQFRSDGSDYKYGNGIDDMCLVDGLISWLDEDIARNFFSIVWTVQGHYPYYFAGIEEDFEVPDYNLNRYLNILEYNDEMIGRIMQELELRGLDKTTLVVVVGDHGEAFKQHNQIGHGTALYEENIKVPLYFINSTLFNGQHKDDIAGMKDLASTTLDIIGVGVPGCWQGRNLLNTNSNEAFFYSPWSDYLFGYRMGNVKYIFNETLKKIEVFDLNIDPGEKNNLIESAVKEEVKYARNRVSAWVQYQNKFANQIQKE